MPNLGGIEAAGRIHRVAPKLQIVFLSQHNSETIAQTALAAGALAYVTKSSASTDLIRAVRAVSEGKKFVSKLVRWDSKPQAE
jgi:two-component system NarL family response regulator